MNKHTPGPWEASYNGHYHDIRFTNADGHTPNLASAIAGKLHPENMGADIEKANAHLIAAAPELLEELLKVMWLGNDKETHCICW